MVTYEKASLQDTRKKTTTKQTLKTRKPSSKSCPSQPLDDYEDHTDRPLILIGKV